MNLPHWLRANTPRRRHIRSGLLGSVVIVALLVGSSTYKSMGLGDKVIHAEFVQAAGLETGDKVRVAGIEVGRVAGARIEGDHVLATLQVDSGLAFGPDAKAEIKTSTILGGTYISLDTGHGKGLPGGRIALSNTVVPFNLAKIVQDPDYPSQFDRLERIDTGKVADAIGVLGSQLGDSPQLTATALDSVGALAKTIDARRGQVDALLKSLDQVAGILDDNRNNILLIMVKAGAIGDRVNERKQLVQGLLDNMAALSRQFQQIGAENNEQLGPMLGQLATMSAGLEKNRTQLDQLLQLMPITVRQFDNVFGNGDYGDVWAPWGPITDQMLCGVPGIIQGCR
ncbi:MAG: mammalian cell entry protein [Nocardia sp.]|uniref:MCE family protein n=1 Tax=Nocardia sp. TaxID=1821 RepID=UPI00260DE969|nr:MCE family protein [Nocardia sp.]MCU1647693.1 mammalian cell entry protein [Nocardia sp.]